MKFKHSWRTHETLFQRLQTLAQWINVCFGSQQNTDNIISSDIYNHGSKKKKSSLKRKIYFSALSKRIKLNCRSFKSLFLWPVLLLLLLHFIWSWQQREWGRLYGSQKLTFKINNYQYSYYPSPSAVWDASIGSQVWSFESFLSTTSPIHHHFNDHFPCKHRF